MLRPTTDRAAIVGAAGLAGFFAAAVTTAAITPGYNWIRDAISALAATDSPHAWLMIAGFLAAAAGLAGTGVALWRRFGAHRSGRVAAVLVLLGVPLAVAAGLARQDCSEALTDCVDH